MQQILLSNGVRVNLAAAVQHSARLQSITVPADTQAAVLDFVARRLEQLLVDRGCGIEVVKAVLSQRSSDPVFAQQSALALQVDLCVCILTPP